VAAVVFGFVSVIVTTLVSFVPIEAGANALAAVIVERTASDELAATVFEPALAVVTAPIASVLLYEPAEALVTFTVTVQEPGAGIVPPESATLVPLFAAVTVPAPHVVAPLADAVLVSPAT